MSTLHVQLYTLKSDQLFSMELAIFGRTTCSIVKRKLKLVKKHSLNVEKCCTITSSTWSRHWDCGNESCMHCLHLHYSVLQDDFRGFVIWTPSPSMFNAAGQTESEITKLIPSPATLPIIPPRHPSIVHLNPWSLDILIVLSMSTQRCVGPT